MSSHMFKFPVGSPYGPICTRSAAGVYLADDQSVEVFRAISRDFIRIEGVGALQFPAHRTEAPHRYPHRGYIRGIDAWYDSLSLVDEQGVIVKAYAGLYWSGCERYPELGRRVVTRASVKAGLAAYRDTLDTHAGYRQAVAAYKDAWAAVDRAYPRATAAQYAAVSAAEGAAHEALPAAYNIAHADAVAACKAALVDVPRSTGHD